MRGDYTRFSFTPRKRYAAVLQQQGRVQLDADWNEAEAIARQRTRLLGLDLFGPVGIGADTTPGAFKITPAVGPSIDLSIAPGRIYVDGVMAELFADETASYLKQPYLPDPPALPAGDVAVYLDVWEREVTWVQDPLLLDAALGGRDTSTRLQTVWQVKVTAQRGATCGLAVGAPPSAGRLSSSAVAPPTPDDPCLLPPVAGYRGLENRLYRVEIHNGGALGTARFKWSRDNGSIVSAVTAIAVAGGQTQLTVNRLGRDAVLGFAIGDWVTVTDDYRELAEESGEMARIVDTQPATNGITLDRPLPASGTRPFGANPAQVAARHTRVQRWDQTASTNTLDADGLIATGATVIGLEDGVTVQFSLDPAGGSFRTGDWWVFAARVATAQVEVLNNAAPRGNIHHYVQLAAITGLGGPSPTPSDCRPSKVAGGDCCCTVCVQVADFQKNPNAIAEAAAKVSAAGGGRVCLGAGTFALGANPLVLNGLANMILSGQGPATVLAYAGPGPAVAIANANGLRLENLAINAIGAQPPATAEPIPIGLQVSNSASVLVANCAITAPTSGQLPPTIDVRNPLELAVGAALVIDGPITGATFRDNLLIGDLGIAALAALVAAKKAAGTDPPPFILTGCSVRNNGMLCPIAGVVLGDVILHQGAYLYFLENAIEGNAVIGGLFAGIFAEGFTNFGAAVRIAANDLEVRNVGIEAWLDGVTIVNNVITQADLVEGGGAPAPTGGTGIVVRGPVSQRLPRVWAQVERNRVVGIAGPGIMLDAPLATVSVIGNVVIGTVGYGIVTFQAAADLTLRENQVSIVKDMGGTAIGIGALTLSAAMQGNDITLIGEAAPTVGAIAGLVLVTGDGNVIGNRIHDIGPASPPPPPPSPPAPTPGPAFPSGIYGILAAGADQLIVSENIIRQSSTSPSRDGLPDFTGIRVIEGAATGEVAVSVLGNVVECAGSLIHISNQPTVTVGAVVTSNRCRRIQPADFPIIDITTATAIVGNNRAQGLFSGDSRVGMAVNAPRGATVIGNIVDGTISVVGGAKVPGTNIEL